MCQKKKNVITTNCLTCAPHKMSSWFNFCTENLQKRCCRYLLQRYVGRFLERKIEPDQLSINVLDGAVSIENIVLDVQVSCRSCSDCFVKKKYKYFEPLSCPCGIFGFQTVKSYLFENKIYS